MRVCGLAPPWASVSLRRSERHAHCVENNRVTFVRSFARKFITLLLAYSAHNAAARTLSSAHNGKITHRRALVSGPPGSLVIVIAESSRVESSRVESSRVESSQVKGPPGQPTCRQPTTVGAQSGATNATFVSCGPNNVLASGCCGLRLGCSRLTTVAPTHRDRYAREPIDLGRGSAWLGLVQLGARPSSASALEIRSLTDGPKSVVARSVGGPQ